MHCHITTLDKGENSGEPRKHLQEEVIIVKEGLVEASIDGAHGVLLSIQGGSDLGLFEINEAFSSVVLRFMRALELDPTRVNVNGGAIAMGHPLGATGAMILGTVLDELERRDLNMALVTLCAGNGLGTATIIERV